MQTGSRIAMEECRAALAGPVWERPLNFTLPLGQWATVLAAMNFASIHMWRMAARSRQPTAVLIAEQGARDIDAAKHEIWRQGGIG